MEDEPRLEVPQGAWVRVLWNAKHTDHDSKWLVQTVLNAGLFAGPPADHVFLHAAPMATHDLRRDLVRAGYR